MKWGRLVFGASAIAVLLSPTVVTAQQGQVVARVTQGPIDLRRNSTDYIQANVGDMLLGGDLVRAKRGIVGQIRCTATGKTWTLPDNGIPLGVTTVCPLPSSFLNRNFGVKNRTRGSSPQLQRR